MFKNDREEKNCAKLSLVKKPFRHFRGVPDKYKCYLNLKKK